MIFFRSETPLDLTAPYSGQKRRGIAATASPSSDRSGSGYALRASSDRISSIYHARGHP
ncbi:MAG TPA: hypothetical protein VEL69_06745 [Ktedonobacteraceae bacterium]|nr:hypothetical protein [Ktedonobacteraceae bacterium]